MLPKEIIEISIFLIQALTFVAILWYVFETNRIKRATILPHEPLLLAKYNKNGDLVLTNQGHGPAYWIQTEPKYIKPFCYKHSRTDGKFRGSIIFEEIPLLPPSKEQITNSILISDLYVIQKGTKDHKSIFEIDFEREAREIKELNFEELLRRNTEWMDELKEIYDRAFLVEIEAIVNATSKQYEFDNQFNFQKVMRDTFEEFFNPPKYIYIKYRTSYGKRYICKLVVTPEKLRIEPPFSWWQWYFWSNIPYNVKTWLMKTIKLKTNKLE